MSKDVVAGVLEMYTPQFAGLEAAVPAFAKAVILVAKAYPDTAHHMQAVPIPADLPIIDIMAENS